MDRKLRPAEHGGTDAGDALNPYAPPKSELQTAPEAGGDLLDATRSRRFLNLAIDYVGLFVLLMLVQLASARTGHSLEGEVWDNVMPLMAMFLYYALFEGVLGRTPGKLLTGTRVVTRDGGRPGFGQILGRTLVRFVPFEPLSFLTSRAVGWHDDWSKTRVVRARPPVPLPAPETPRNSGIASSAISGAGTSAGMVDRRAPTSSET